MDNTSFQVYLVKVIETHLTTLHDIRIMATISASFSVVGWGTVIGYILWSLFV